jgi:hypothetical protein
VPTSIRTPSSRMRQSARSHLPDTRSHAGRHFQGQHRHLLVDSDCLIVDCPSSSVWGLWARADNHDAKHRPAGRVRVGLSRSESFRVVPSCPESFRVSLSRSGSQASNKRHAQSQGEEMAPLLVPFLRTAGRRRPGRPGDKVRRRRRWVLDRVGESLQESRPSRTRARHDGAATAS